MQNSIISNEFPEKKAAEGFEQIYIPLNLKTINDVNNAFNSISEQLKHRKNQVSQIEKENCLNDFQRFCEVYLSHRLTVNDKFMPFHKVQIDYVNEILSNRVNSLTQLRISRSYGKTTLLLCLLIFLLIRQELNFVMYCSATEEMAAYCLNNIKLELISNEKLNSHFGTFDIKTRGGDFICKNSTLNIDCLFGSYGLGTQVRGSLYNSHRPTFICTDDIDMDEATRNPERIKKCITWFKSELYGCKDMNKYRITSLGNRFAQHMVLQSISEMSNCKTFTLSALDSNSQSTWPERFSTEMLLQERQNTGPLYFDREMNHIPMSTSEIFPAEHLQFAQPEYSQFGRTIAFYDGSLSVINGDYKAIVILTIVNDCYYIHDLYVRKGTQESALMWLAEKYKFLQSKNIPMTMYYDSTFFQKELVLQVVRNIEKQIGFHLPIIGQDQKVNKIQKIEQLQPLWFRKLIFFNKELENGLDFSEAKNELFNWIPEESNSKRKDDFLDALISAILINQIGSKTSIPITGSEKFRY